MPIYEYSCLKCGHNFEIITTYSGELVNCPICSGEVERLLSTFNHTFGWRLTEQSHERFAKDEFERDI